MGYRWFKVYANRIEPCSPDSGFIPGVFVTYNPVHDCFDVYFATGTVENYQALRNLVSEHTAALKRTMPPLQSGQDPGQG